MAHLSVNVDHVATLRQARQAPYPDPKEAAMIAERAGASGVTIHLRGDRRHIQDDDVRSLRQAVHGKLNLEMAMTDEMVTFALECKPDQVTLVPERAEEVTTEGGLDVLTGRDRICEVANRLVDSGISVSAFIDPDPRQIGGLSELTGGLALGFEINTDAYAKARGTEIDSELGKILRSAEQGVDDGLHVYAGHGLNTENVGPIASIPQIEELNIGHAIVARSVVIGMEAAVMEMLAAMKA